MYTRIMVAALEYKHAGPVEAQTCASPFCFTYSDTLVTLEVHTPEPSEAHKNLYQAFASNPVMFRDPFGFVSAWAFWDPESAVGRQFVSIGDAFGSTLARPFYPEGARQVFQEAVNNSGQAILDEECAGKGAKTAYWGAIGVSAVGVAGAGGANLFNAGAASTFYSGSYPLAYEAALAGKGSGMLITETLGGRAMVWLGVNSDKAWRVASAIFAANATGTAQVFLRNPSVSSVWSTVEQPILLLLRNAELVFK